MTFKETPIQFQLVEVTSIEPGPSSPRQNIDESSLKNLANSIRKMGLIHPLILQPADADGRHSLIVGERRWRAAVMAGEKMVPALIRACPPSEVLDVQVSENMGLGVRSALEPREMANAIQTIAKRFEDRETAAEHFGGSPAWLDQATAAANLSPKITALLDSGKISSTGTAIQLQKLSRKNEARADILIGQVEQLPEGEKLSKKVVDRAISEEGGRRKKVVAVEVAAISSAPQGGGRDAATAPDRNWLNPGKVKRVASLLGLPDGDETEILVRLIDEFLALKEESLSS